MSFALTSRCIELNPHLSTNVDGRRDDDRFTSLLVSSCGTGLILRFAID